MLTVWQTYVALMRWHQACSGMATPGRLSCFGNEVGGAESYGRSSISSLEQFFVDRRVR